MYVMFWLTGGLVEHKAKNFCLTESAHNTTNTTLCQFSGRYRLIYQRPLFLLNLTLAKEDEGRR